MPKHTDKVTKDGHKRLEGYTSIWQKEKLCQVFIRGRIGKMCSWRMLDRSKTNQKYSKKSMKASLEVYITNFINRSKCIVTCKAMR